MFRIGHGYDVHKLVKGRNLILGGVKIPHELGLLGHSDADVLVHAVMDSLLGAACLGDIGKHFPDNNCIYKDIDSLILLKKTAELLSGLEYSVGNIDCTIICQKPKLAEFIPEMRSNLAEILNCSLDCVNIKATTEEGLGFTGNCEGISAHSVALIYKK